MSLKEVPMYQVICDRCEANAQEDSDYWAWADKGQAWDAASDADWLAVDGDGETPARHYCTECVHYDPELDEYAPKPPETAEAAS